MSDWTPQEALATAALRRLGRDPATAALTSRVLAGGLSGSSVHHLDLAGDAMVLKVTQPSEDRQLMMRAGREVLFYQDLATHVPVLVPRVLGLDFNETEGAVLLLAAYLPSPSPDAWTVHNYVEVARQLGRLHAASWDKTAASSLPNWLHAKPAVTLAQCREAAKVWHVLSERDDLRDALVPYRRSLEHLVMSIPTLDPHMTTMPATLCHGDCHAGNLLLDRAGEWIWADWQEVRLGPGVDDLAFFWQRSFVAADMTPPYDAMVQAYVVGLETGGEVQIIREQLDRALAWAELRSWLVDWPRYLGALSSAQMERVLQRIEKLVRHLADR